MTRYVEASIASAGDCLISFTASCCSIPLRRHVSEVSCGPPTRWSSCAPLAVVRALRCIHRCLCISSLHGSMTERMLRFHVRFSEGRLASDSTLRNARYFQHIANLGGCAHFPHAGNHAHTANAAFITLSAAFPVLRASTDDSDHPHPPRFRGSKFKFRDMLAAAAAA